MKKLTSFIVSLILLLSLSTGVKAEFFSDIIVTSPNAIWTDSRAYTNLPAAINAVGSLQRTIVISSQQSIGNMTVPSNVTLKFERDGAIINSGQLTINTKNIIAENRQIFAGAGDIDFASGTVLKSGWFSTFERALSVTSDDIVTLLITKAQTLTTTTASGNNVTLKWDSPGNILTANAGVTISNIGQVESGNYQLFAGAGNFRFRDGTKLNLSWFANLRAFLTYASTNKLTLTVPGANAVDYSNTIPSTILLDMDSQHGQFTVAPGITLSFSGYTKDVYAHWFGDLTKATLDTVKASVGTTNKVTVVLIPGTWTIDDDLTITSNISLKVQPGALLTISTTKTLTINGPFDAGLYQVFSCKGTGKVVFGIASAREAYSEWWGAKGDNSTDCTAGLLAAIASKAPVVKLLAGIYNYTTTLSLSKAIHIYGAGTMAYEGDATWSAETVTQLHYTGSDQAIQMGTDPSIVTGSIRLSDFWLSGTSSATNGIVMGDMATITNIHDCPMNNITITGFTKTGAAGLFISEADETIFTNVYTYSNYDGIRIGRSYAGVNGTVTMTRFMNCKTRSNARYGIYIAESCFDLSFFNLKVESNYGPGLVIDNVSGATGTSGIFHINFYSYYSENNARGGAYDYANIINSTSDELDSITHITFYSPIFMDGSGAAADPTYCMQIGRVSYVDIINPLFHVTGILKVETSASSCQVSTPMFNRSGTERPDSVTNSNPNTLRFIMPAEQRIYNSVVGDGTSYPFYAAMDHTVWCVTDLTNHKSAIFALNATTVTLMLDPDSGFSVSEGAAKFNIFYDVGSGTFKYNNRTGSTITYVMAPINGLHNQ